MTLNFLIQISNSTVRQNINSSWQLLMCASVRIPLPIKLSSEGLALQNRKSLRKMKRRKRWMGWLGFKMERVWLRVINDLPLRNSRSKFLLWLLIMQNFLNTVHIFLTFSLGAVRCNFSFNLTVRKYKGLRFFQLTNFLYNIFFCKFLFWFYDYSYSWCINYILENFGSSVFIFFALSHCFLPML